MIRKTQDLTSKCDSLDEKKDEEELVNTVRVY